MKLASDALKIVTYENAELAKKPPLRAGEQIASDEAENDNLIGLLGEIDGLKQEIHERMRRVEAVKQAKSVLIEDALRTEALNKRLAEMGKVMSSVHPGLQAAEHRSEDPEGLRMQARELLADSEPKLIQGKSATEAVTLPWRRPEDPVESSLHGRVEQTLQLSAVSAPQIEDKSISADAGVAYQAAVRRLEQSEQEWADAWKRADEAAAEARRLFEESTARLDLAAAKQERAAAEFHSAQAALTIAFDSAKERLEEAEQYWRRADGATLETKRLFDESASRLDLAVSKEELATSQFESAKETLTTAYRSANERLEEAERCWKQTDQIVLEARQMLEQSTSELDQARRREEAVAASLETVRKEFSTAYQSASQRLEEAERLCQKGDQAAKEAQHAIDQTTAELLQARSAEEKAAADLVSARQELTTAYQFASVAAQRRLDAAELFQKAIRWAVFATAFSSVALVWALWLALRAIVPIWGAGAASALVILVAIIFGRLRTREI
jgi:hypothetical protein